MERAELIWPLLKLHYCWFPFENRCRVPTLPRKTLKVVLALTGWDTLMRNALWCVAVEVAAGACANSSDKIAASYVLPYQYDSFTCPEVAGRASEG